MRSEPSHRAEQSSQLLFGEKAEVLEINNKNWARIRCFWDDYEGWCNLSQLKLVERELYRKETKFVCSGHDGMIILPGGVMRLPVGSELTGLKNRKIHLLSEPGIYKGKKINKKVLVPSQESLKKTVHLMMNAPYQWGGRSIYGIDCSGLTQVVYKLCNFKLPRNAQEQSGIGTVVAFLENAQCGDLAFFDDENGKINHVGLLLDNQTIIHASEMSGRVGVDFIDNGGIISKTLKKRTHKLRIVKRMITG